MQAQPAGPIKDELLAVVHVSLPGSDNLSRHQGS